MGVICLGIGVGVIQCTPYYYRPHHHYRHHRYRGHPEIIILEG
jgi:hypothetical protein